MAPCSFGFVFRESHRKQWLAAFYSSFYSKANLGVILGLYWGYAWVLLGLYLGYIGVILGLYQGMLGLYWYNGK